MPVPRISIVTVNFNQSAFLEQTILSVISQGYPNLEYIIIDGGSTDGSVDIIKKYASHLHYWVSEPDNGLYEALQKGFSRSTGEIMAWINSDDLYHPYAFKMVADIFGRFPDIRWIMGSNSFFTEDGNCFNYGRDRADESWSQTRMFLRQGSFIQQESVFWRRDLWNAAGGYISQEHSLAADFELWLRFFRHEKLYSVSFLLAGFRLRRGQLSQRRRDEYMLQIRALLNAEKLSARQRTRIFFCRILLPLTNLAISPTWQQRLVFRLLQIPPRIVFDPEKGLAFREK